jgi:hypothetical protein
MHYVCLWPSHFSTHIIRKSETTPKREKSWTRGRFVAHRIKKWVHSHSESLVLHQDSWRSLKVWISNLVLIETTNLNIKSTARDGCEPILILLVANLPESKEVKKNEKKIKSNIVFNKLLYGSGVFKNYKFLKWNLFYRYYAHRFIFFIWQ